MSHHAFRLLNVFAESTFGGNPLAVFEDARGLDAATMQALALQFNLSETAFVLPSERADAKVRVFTIGSEMRFAGHPALGTAHVVRELAATGDALTLEFEAGVVPLLAQGDVWTFTAPRGEPPLTAPVALPAARMAAILGLRESDLLAAPIWVDTGSDQLLVPVNSVEAVRRAQPDSRYFEQWPLSRLGRRTAYVFAFDPQRAGQVLSRYFFVRPGGGAAEDPGTGSACANLGGWLLANGHALPAAYRVEQGAMMGRPSLLRLEVATDRSIRVGGRVMEIGRGVIEL